MLSVKGIDAIFQKGDGDGYKDKSRMYQDMLIFGSTIQENEESKLWDLDKYPLYNNEKLRDRTAAKDKMKCLIYKCQCKSFVPDRKYYRSTKK